MSARATDYTATIDWGDGSPTGTGTVTGKHRSFSVSDGHTYIDKGSHTITDAAPRDIGQRGLHVDGRTVDLTAC